jgi:hypothetical protein
MSTDADRARLAEIQRHHRHDVDLGRWDNDELDLYRMAEDGIAARDELESLKRSIRDLIRADLYESNGYDLPMVMSSALEPLVGDWRVLDGAS